MSQSAAAETIAFSRRNWSAVEADVASLQSGRMTTAMSLGPGEPAAGPWQVRPLADLLHMVLTAAGEPPGRPRVVAVDGRSAGGKTTIANRVRVAVPSSAVVHTDDVAWYESFFGWDTLLADGVLAPARRGEPVQFRPPAWDERSREGAIEVPADLDLLIVEGVGAARRELMPLLDAVVWVQSDMVEAERRGILRDGGTPEIAAFWHRWQAEELPFLAEDRPWERACVVVAGTVVLPHAPHEVVLAAAFPPPPPR
jgi:hypothetical protein